MSEESYVMVFGEVFSYTQIIKNEKIVEGLKKRRGHLCIGERDCKDCYLDYELQKIIEGELTGGIRNVGKG